jgi:hypothetical protein
VRYDAAIKRWYQKKCASGLAVVAIKAVAHKLARACRHVMKYGKPFEVSRAFGSRRGQASVLPSAVMRKWPIAKSKAL